MNKCFKNIEKANERHTKGIKKSHHLFYVESRRIKKFHETYSASPRRTRLLNRSRLELSETPCKGVIQYKDHRHKLPSQKEIEVSINSLHIV